MIGKFSYKFPRFISPTAQSQALAVSAIYVSDGFTHELDVMQAPSVTNTFFTACTWFQPLRTEVFGSRPMRAVPISWIAVPG